MAEAQEQGTLDEFAKNIKQANESLQVQTQYFETIRDAIQILSAYEQDNTKCDQGLPIIEIKNRGNSDEDGIKIDLDLIGPASALTIKPFLEMAAGAVGIALRQSWERINQVNAQAQQVLQVADRLQQQHQQQQQQ